MGAFFGIRPIIGVVAALAIAVGFAAPAQAATYTVGTTSDTTPGTLCATFPSGCSLRQLIERENTAGTNDTIAVPAGSYSLTNGQLNITQNMTIAGAGARTTTIAQQTTTSTSRVFAILANSQTGFTPTVTISGLDMFFGKADLTSTPAFFGGDIVNEGTLTLSEDFVEDGTTTSGSGAGISNYGGTLTVTHSLVASNGSSQTNDSGGIQNFGPNPVTNSPGKLAVIDSTIANNTSAQGGGIMSWGDASNTAQVINSTITGNDGGGRQTFGGGLLASDGGTISVQNTIVAGNTVDNPNPATPSNCGTTGSTPGTIKSLGYDLESATDCGFKSTGDHQSTDPGFLSGPSDYGGNTNTFALKATSPAVDAIPPGALGCALSDQRDISRPHGSGCDIGAFELFQPTEGQQFTTVVGAVSGTSVSIAWGDGSSTPATPAPTTSQVTGTHTYAEEGIYHGVINYDNSDGTPSQFPFDVKVQDAPLAATATQVSTTAGTPFTGSVATFTDANPGGTVSEYSATISWGDGTTSAGAVTAGAGNFVVSGSHTYASPGTYHTTVTIKDVGGASATATGTAAAAGPPAPVITGAPVVTGPNGAAFSGTVNPNGLATSAYFQYGIPANAQGPEGPGPTFTQFTPTQTVGSDFSNHTISASAAGLVPNEVYEVQLVATNSAGTSYGPIQTFTTAQNNPPPPPVLGKQVNVRLVSGQVWIKPPPGKTLGPAGDSAALSKGQGFVPLTEARQIPTGSEVDALHGSLKIVTATGHVGKTQTATISGGLFTLAQNRTGISKGLTNFALQEGAFQGAPSYATCKPKGKKAADQATIAALSSKTLQLLKARAHGKFKTTGRYSSATVRGTIWTIADRCDGTLTHAIRDTVLVQDFVRHKTILLHAGHTYLARAIASHK